MKLNFGKKLLLFLHWLLSLIICVLFVLNITAPGCIRGLVDLLQAAVGSDSLLKIIAFVALAVYALICIFSLVVIFSRDRKREERGFITVDASDAGKTRIAVGAVEQMIRQAVAGVDGIAEMKCGITNVEDAISINAVVTLVSGAHVPTVTMNMQRAIRGYIELNCGVAVREICISVNSVDASAEGKRGHRKNVTAAVPAAYAEPVKPAEPVAAEEPAEVQVPAETTAEEVAEETETAETAEE